MVAPTSPLGLSPGVRRSPFFESTLKHGAKSFSVYNHMYFPGPYGTEEENYWSLVNNVVLCDVAIQRQVEIRGRDASRFVQLLTPRDLSQCGVGQCKYIVVTTEEGCIVNDPVLLRLEVDRYWLSSANSDLILWVKGLRTFSGLDVSVSEPDAWPVQVQGPKSPQVMEALFGEGVRELRYYRNSTMSLDGMSLVVSRTGYSGERGYEIFLRDADRGADLWEAVMAAGEPFGIRADTTSGIRRIEAGMLAYQTDMTIENNPFEVGLEWLVDLESGHDFVGKGALETVKREGPKVASCGLEILGGPLPARNAERWALRAGGANIGAATSCIASPRLGKNIALALVLPAHAQLGQRCLIGTPWGERDAVVVPKPFYDPKKTLARTT
jgi:aminomethyltransferase